MSSIENKFNDFCRSQKIGELATNENTHPTTLKVCEAFKKFFEKKFKEFENMLEEKSGKKINVYLGYCSNPSLNAFAAQFDKKQYFVGINIGVFVQLGNLFEELFSQERSFLKKISLGSVHSKFGRTQIIANVANFAAIHYLIFHELGHIAYGHTDLIKDKFGGKGQNLLMEMNTTPKSNTIAPELFQSMEVDADLFASSAIFYSIIHSGSLCGLDMSHFIKSKDELLEIAMISVFSMFHLFYGDEKRIDAFKFKTHPLPEIRLLKFWMRTHQLRGVIKDTTISTKGIIDKVMKWFPNKQNEPFFPSLRLEGKLSLSNEASRIRANENLYQPLLETYAKVPIGTVIV